MLASIKTTSTSSPTNGEGDIEMGVQEAVTLTNFMSAQESQDGSSEDKASDDRNIIAQVDEVASEQEVTAPAREADGDTQEMEAPSSSSGNADIIAMSIESEADLLRERDRIVAKNCRYTSLHRGNDP